MTANAIRDIAKGLTGFSLQLQPRLRRVRFVPRMPAFMLIFRHAHAAVQQLHRWRPCTLCVELPLLTIRSKANLDKIGFLAVE